MDSQTPSPYHTDSRLDSFLAAISPAKGRWPTEETDWAPARALQADGVDLVWGCGKAPKTTVFHRLTKQIYKMGLCLSNAERLAPFRHLSHLTNGHAMAPVHTAAWDQLSSSYAIMSGPGAPFHTRVLDLFIEHAERFPLPEAETPGIFASMLHRATCVDSPERMAWLCEHSPAPLDFCRFIDNGGTAMFAALVARGEDFLRPRHEWGTRQSLKDRIEGSVGPIKEAYANWARAQAETQRLEAALPAAPAAVPRKPRSRF